MILKRLLLKDFRQFQNKNQIDFSTKKDKHISIIFASNGVGKTTILAAIVWCLYGGKELPFGDLRNQFLNKNIFYNLKEGEEELAEVTLVFENRGKEYVVTRSVTVAKNNNEQINRKFDLLVEIDNQPQYYAQEKIDSVLGPAMKEYFFFDGEGIGKLADTTRPELIQKGIINVMKIDTRKEALELIQKTKKIFDKESTQLQEKYGIIDIPEEKIDRIENKIEEKKELLIKAENDKDTFEYMLREIDKELLRIRDIKKEAEQKISLQQELENIKKLIKKTIDEQKNLITKKAYIALSKNIFDNVHQIILEKQEKGELPIVGISRHFIEELLEKHECICGTKFKNGDEHYNHLINIMNRASAKSEIEKSINLLGSFVEAHLNDYNTFQKSLFNNLEEIDNYQNRENELEAQIEAIENELEKGLEKLLKNEENLITKQKNIYKERDETIAKITQLKLEIESLEDQLKKLKKDLETSQAISEEVQLLRNRIKFCEKAIELLGNKNKEEIETIRKELSNRLKEKFNTLLHSNKTAELDDSFRLIIKGEDGQPTAKSRGEDKLISLIFISTLIDMAKEREIKRDMESLSAGAGIYPIVVDSPYGEFDTVYKKTISETLKNLAPQVILLMSQEQWNEDIETVFDGSIAHAYYLVAHRPKLNNLKFERNRLYFKNKVYDLEIQDDKEFTTIERIEV